MVHIVDYSALGYFEGHAVDFLALGCLIEEHVADCLLGGLLAHGLGLVPATEFEIAVHWVGFVTGTEVDFPPLHFAIVSVIADA